MLLQQIAPQMILELPILLLSVIICTNMQNGLCDLLRCRTDAGLSGVCVARKLCRVKLAVDKRTSCPLDNSQCCPFPSNETESLEDDGYEHSPVLYLDDDDNNSEVGMENPPGTTIPYPQSQRNLTPSQVIQFGTPQMPACGQAPYEPFIAGGVESDPFKWPWMASIFQRFTVARPHKFLCGGSLLNTRYILTAAHCCVTGATNIPRPASSFLVRMGSNHLEQGGEDFSVSKVTVHSNFSYSGQYNDIALLKLGTKVAYTDRVAPVCLPDLSFAEQDFEGLLATVIGWGATSVGGEHQQTLHEVEIPIVSTDDCVLAYSRIKSAAFLARGSTHILCAGLKEGGKDACKSDSGGPLMMQLDGIRWTIVGIVSFGHRCAEPGFPGVYTKITHYLEWISSNAID